jgi:hypothetical protein
MLTLYITMHGFMNVKQLRIYLYLEIKNPKFQYREDHKSHAVTVDVVVVVQLSLHVL